MSGVWREPPEESANLYPGLVVHDGVVSGSITVGRSRLPLWAIIRTAITDGWRSVTAGWNPSPDFDEEALATFLHDLLEMRGEFGRLLLVLAAAEREAICRDDVTHGGEPWWDHEPSRSRVIEQLQRCLTVLTGPPTSTAPTRTGDDDA